MEWWIFLYYLLSGTTVSCIRLSTPSGVVDGRPSTSEKDVNVFFGVPFANPAKRFAKPEMVTPWSGVRDATSHKPSCYQNAIPGTVSAEDCLYLDIYVPSGGAESKAVMVWIYGGAFILGGSSQYDGSLLAKTGDVIVVAINYRLGVFGWVYAEGEIPANLGLWDQKLALEWVQANIQAFGGEKNKVTVFGESAGSISIAALIMSPMINTNHFQRAIMQSGSTLMGDPSSMLRGRDWQLMLYGTGCIFWPNKLACLSRCPAWQLDLITKLSLFLPAPDGQFIMESPLKLLSDYGEQGFTDQVAEMVGNIGQYDVIIGFNGQEGYLLLAVLDPVMNLHLETGIYDYTYSFITDLVIITMAKKIMLTTELSSYLRGKYPDLIPKRNQYENNMNNLLDILGDFMMAIPAINTALLHSEASQSKNTYMYLFDHVPASGSMVKAGPKWLQTSASHSDDVKFVINLNVPKGANESKVALRPEERVLRRAMMTYWSNFAKDGNPRTQDFEDRGNHVWQKFSKDVRNYMRLTLRRDDPNVNPRGDKQEVWKCVYEASYQDDASKCKGMRTVTSDLPFIGEGVPQYLMKEALMRTSIGYHLPFAPFCSLHARHSKSSPNILEELIFSHRNC